MNSMNCFDLGRSSAKLIPAILVLCSIFMIGCDAPDGSGSASGNGAGGGKNSDGFKIDWGTGSVEIGGDGSVDVKAPGVDVQRKVGEGVSVKANNVDVDVQEADGSDQSGRVKVNAGGVNIDTNPSQ